VTEIWGCIPRGDRDVSWDSAVGEEGVVNDVVQRGTLLGVGCEYLLYELTRIGRDLPVRWKLVLIIPDTSAKAELGCEVSVSLPENSLIYFFDVLGLKRGTSDDKRIEDDTDGPNINLEAVSIRGVEQYLRGNVVWCTTNGLLPLARTLNQRGKTKVADLDIHITIKEKVPELQITMDDLMGMHVMTGTDELYHKESRLRLCEHTTAMEHAHERPVGTKLQSHVDILFVLKAVEKANDVGMVQRFVDLNLCIKLEDCSASRTQLIRVGANLGLGFLCLERALRHDLTGKQVITGIPNLIHSGKPALKGGWVNGDAQAGYIDRWLTSPKKDIL
jgi:hypothetical protein